MVMKAPRAPTPRFTPLTFGIIAATIEMAIILAIMYC
jgi:hypothetical protein